MYAKHVGKRNILLWAYSHVKNPSKKGDTNFDAHKKNPSKKGDTNFDAHKKSLVEVDKKYDELREKHGSKYSLEQLRMWAHVAFRKARLD